MTERKIPSIIYRNHTLGKIAAEKWLLLEKKIFVALIDQLEDNVQNVIMGIFTPGKSSHCYSSITFQLCLFYGTWSFAREIYREISRRFLKTPSHSLKYQSLYFHGEIKNRN